MNKLLAFLCALTLVLSLSVTAFAVDGTYGKVATGSQTITVNSPALTWTMEIPADSTIEFGKTETCIGDFKITNVSLDYIPGFIYGWINYDGKLTGRTNSLSYMVQCEIYNDDNILISGNGNTKYIVWTGSDWGDETSEHPRVPVYYQRGSASNHYAKLYVSIADAQWNLAVPGDTYKGTVTYSSEAVLF